MVSHCPFSQSLPPRVRWPIVGREQEIDNLLDKLRSGKDGVLVVGPPGMGKSTVVSAALAAYQDGAGEASQAADAPSAVVRLPLPHENSTPLTTFGPLTGNAGHVPATLEALAALVLENLITAPGGLPPVIYAEDLHLFDDDSAKVLRMVLMNGQARLFASVRENPGMPTAIDSLWRSGRVERIELAPLSYESVRLILRCALEEPASNDMAYRLWLTTAGNPLHVRELLYSIVAAGDVKYGGIALTWTAPLRADRRLTDLLARDITTLSPEQRTIADLVALAETVPLATISAMASDSVLRELVDRLLIVIDTPESGQANVRIGHPLYAETLRSLLYPQRKRDLFEYLPQHELHAQGPAGISRWVDWALECQVMPDVGTLVLAGETAESMTQPRGAVRLATLALGHADMNDAERVQALLLRARAFRDLGETLKSESDIMSVREHASSGGLVPDGILAQCASVMADLWQFHRGDMETALLQLAEAEKAVDPMGEHASALAIDQLSRLGYGGRYEEFLAGIDAALAASDHPANMTLVPSHVFALGQAGKPTTAMELAVRQLGGIGPEHASFPALRTAILSARFWAAQWMGDPVLAAFFPDVVEDIGQRHDSGIYQTGTGYACLSFGQWEQATGEFRGALSRFAAGPATGLEPLAWAGLAFAYVHRGDLERARSAREEYRDRESTMNRSIETESRYRVLLVGSALADADLARQIDEFVLWCTEAGSALGVMWGLHLRVVHAEQIDRAALTEALEEAAGLVEGKVPSAMVAHARALVEGDAGVIASAVAELNTMGVWIPSVPAPIALTARQREIGSLIVAGMSNRSIAEKLTISVRTVDTHVGHLFERLGVTKRTDLASALTRSAPSWPGSKRRP